MCQTICLLAIQQFYVSKYLFRYVSEHLVSGNPTSVFIRAYLSSGSLAVVLSKQLFSSSPTALWFKSSV